MALILRSSTLGDKAQPEEAQEKSSVWGGGGAVGHGGKAGDACYLSLSSNYCM